MDPDHRIIIELPNSPASGCSMLCMQLQLLINHERMKIYYEEMAKKEDD